MNKKILLANLFSLIIYLLLIFNSGLLGYMAVPLLLLAYIFIFCISVSSIRKGINMQSIPLSLCALFSMLWVTYGIGSDLFFHGIDFKIMVSLQILSIVINLYFYLQNEKL